MVLIYNFTYNDYIKFIHNIKQEKYFKLNEDLEEYMIIQFDKINEKYRRIMKVLFQDKKRLENLINKFTPEEDRISAEELEYVEYIEEKDNLRIIYKKTDEVIFYLIIYQKEINLNLPYDILNYCTKIIHKQKKENSNDIVIVPIVIYLQNNRYNYKENVDNFFELTTYDNNILELRYNLIKLLDLYDMQEIDKIILLE